MRDPESEDRRQARRLLAGDEEAFRRFFDSSFPRLFRFAIARLDDVDAAREVVQATLVKALDKLATYRGEADMFSWLCSICRHEIADLGRSRRRLVEAPIEETPGVRAALESLAAAVADPEALARRAELVRLVHATLDHLPHRYGAALEMRYLEALSVPEIARRLGLGYKAAESTLSRARAAFRDGFEAVLGAAAKRAEGA